MSDYDELISQSQANVKALSEKLKDLDSLHLEIRALKESSEEIPVSFNNKFKEIVELSEGYTNALGGSVKIYLDGNNTLISEKLKEFSVKLKQFEAEIDRLLNTDFVSLFQTLQKVFIEKTREDLVVELKRFEKNAQDLHNGIADLKVQVNRLEGIDLEKNFDKLQRTLSELFGAVNAINLTFLNVVQTITGIVQSLGVIQNSINSSHKDTVQRLSNYVEHLDSKFSNQVSQADRHFELLNGKLDSLADTNHDLAKKLKLTNLVQYFGFSVIVLMLLFIAFR